jgi:hypothetical protein
MNGKFNLAAFHHAIMNVGRKDGSKVECIVIPIKENNLFKSDKGNVYCDFKAWPIAPEKRKGDDTHLINQSLKKEDREALKAAGKYPPMLGTLKEYQAESPDTVDQSFTSEVAGDLPF